MQWIGTKRNPKTLKVRRDVDAADDFTVIRAEDFDAKTMQLLDDSGTTVADNEPAKPEPEKSKRGRPRKKAAK